MLKNNTTSQNAFTDLSMYPAGLLSALQHVEKKAGDAFFLSGGTVRDWLLGRSPSDLDISVKKDAVGCCRELIGQLGAGAFVMLGRDDDEAARVVWQNFTLDFSSFRKDAQTMEEDLCFRDYTINSMAVKLTECLEGEGCTIIDPLGGIDDLRNKTLKCCPGAFDDDPLRMLRGFRLQAELGFSLDADAIRDVQLKRETIRQCAAERIQHELDLIMYTGSASKVFRLMADTGILFVIFPELHQGVGLEQPGYHHEDVFNHGMLALSSIEKIFDAPQDYFGKYHEVIEHYLDFPENRVRLRWAALFHDLGKPATHSSGTMGERATFYNHDRVGREMFELVAGRLRWSRTDVETVGSLIEMHMHPFHLSNIRRQEAVSRKALVKIFKKAGDDLPGLFILAMADSLAGQGELKPEDMEQELSSLFDEVQETVDKYIRPSIMGERFVTGQDLITVFNLSPGPLFREILEGLEIARVEDHVRTKEEAFSWVASYLDNIVNN